MSKERINIYVTERQKRQLEKRSDEEKLPMAEIIRRALDAYLAWDDPTYTPTPITPQKERRSHPPHE
jgi:Ribbon-helix-helix protein, copG family